MSALDRTAPLYDADLNGDTVDPTPYAARRVRRRGWLVRRMLALADVTGLFAAFLLAQVLAGPGGSTTDHIDAPTEILLFLLTLPLWIVAAKIYGLYDLDEERADHSTVDEFGRVFHLISIGSWVFFAFAWFTNLVSPYLPKLLLFWLFAVPGVTLARAAARSFCRRRVAYLQNTVIVGAGDVGQLVARKLLDHPELGINLIGFIDSAPKKRGEGLADVALLGSPNELPRLVPLLEVERVIVAFSGDSHQETLDLIRLLKGLDVQLSIVPRLFETLGPSAGIQMIEGLPLVALPPLRLTTSSLLLKRGVDFVVALVALLLLAPVLLFVALGIKLDSPGPVFYRHRRVTWDGIEFDVFKFRTMFLDACRGDRYGGALAEEAFEQLMSDPPRRREFDTTYKLQDDPRVTGFGRVLRRTSLDELPQLFNVLRGDISLVGPRPITHAELERYADNLDLFLTIKPGITGYWQINGRSGLAYDERIRLDLAYVGAWSLGLDLSILAKTMRVLVTRRGAA